MIPTACGATTRIGGAKVQALIPHGVSHIKAIIGQPPRAIAMGPASTHTAIAITLNTFRRIESS